MTSCSAARILGIDPGTRVAGYGLVEARADGTIRALAVGAWCLDEKLPLAARLASLAIEFRRVVAAHSPQIVCVELPFVSNNARSALVLGSARGVILSEAYQAGMEISEIAATSAKKMITGNGYSDKERVMQTLQSLLRADLSELPYDATDALAIAYAHGLRRHGEGLVAKGTDSCPERSHLLKAWADSQKRTKRSIRAFANSVR